MSVLIDGREMLSETIAVLINKISGGEPVPELWKVSKTIPIHKKGDLCNVQNYRPISNICSIGKVYEKWMLLRIGQIEKFNNISLTGKRQHGFKKNHSTMTAMLDLQNEIAEHMDGGDYVGLISLDLSAAFDVVDHKTLFKRLRKSGLPEHLIKLITDWLSNRLMYVEVDGKTSLLIEIDCGTLQGSVLGPVLFALFIAPIYETVNMCTYADDNFLVEHDSTLNGTIGKVKMKAERTIKWLRESGMKVNADKTEFCIFHHNDVRPSVLVLDNVEIKSKRCMNILGVIFDSKLRWQQQVDNVISKCNRALHAINLIKHFFNTDERLHIINAFFYSKLYYCSVVWLNQLITSTSKKKLKSISARALRLVTGDDYMMFSFDELHCMFNRATPIQWSMYQHCLFFYKLFNNQLPEDLWLELCEVISISERTTKIVISRQFSRRVGLNRFCNRLGFISDFINVNNLNLGLDTFKVKLKRDIIY